MLFALSLDGNAFCMCFDLGSRIPLSLAFSITGGGLGVYLAYRSILWLYLGTDVEVPSVDVHQNKSLPHH
jgi:hypothetical protein